jgi:hypothetical protein
LATECTQRTFDFQPIHKRDIVARFDGGNITSDGGALLLREVELRTGIVKQFAACFQDHRDPALIEHSVEHLVAQRVFGLALGYEDLNDHDQLRADPLLAVVVNHPDPLGQKRRKASDRGKALASKSTLNRLELTPADANAGSRYKKIVYNRRAIEDLFVELFLQAHDRPPAEIVLDLDATDDPLHGNQQGRFFHGYYGGYCYLPLYIFCGEQLLCARLRPANLDGAAGALKILKRLVAQLRARWPQVRIVLRGDSGFCREHLMAWCEVEGHRFVFGLARNSRLEAELAPELAQAAAQFQATKQPARVFKDFVYQTRESWCRARRVVGKAEHLAKGANPRFVVTNLPAAEQDARRLYEDNYCGRGEMENRIKEQQLYLFADRTSAATMRANQLRLWFSSLAYVLTQTLRRLGLQNTEWQNATCQTIRLKLLKIGAQIKVTVRKIWLSLAEGYPWKSLFAEVYRKLQALPLRC